MAYLRKRGNTWSYTVDVGVDPTTGRRKQKTRGGFKTKKEAALEAASVERDVANNEFYAESDITFSAFALEWHAEYSLAVKVSTADLRLRMLGILNQYFGTSKMRNITRKQYQDTLNTLCQKYSYNTVGIIHSTARLIFKRAAEYDVIRTDPTEHCRIMRKKKTVEEIEDERMPKYMEKEELARFLQTIKKNFDHQDFVLFYLLAYTGMRIGEATALKWDDISFEDQTISITKTCYLPKNKSMNFELLTPKTVASRREIAIYQDVLIELNIHKANQDSLVATLNKHGDLYKDHGFVFTSYKNLGYPYNKATAESRMKRALELSNLNRRLSPHSLRHTHTSLLAEAGVGLTEIMDRLGHEDDSITKRIYLHVTKTKKAEASQRFAELMNNVVKM
ncbi:site-specific integrase [Paenibacillus larvae]